MNNAEKPTKITVTNAKDTRDKYDELKKQLETNRFFIDKDLDIFVKFIDGIPSIHIDKGSILYRARKGEYSNKKDLDAPGASICTAGRLNPKQIQYLYVASSEKTAISEVRPWIGSKITVAKFSPIKKLKIIDFTDNNISIPASGYRKIINERFSRPISSKDSDIEYLPTQAIAEYIKNKGYDGIKYKSSIDKNGYNLVIFNVNNMKNIEITDIVIVSDIEYLWRKCQMTLLQKLKKAVENNQIKEPFSTSELKYWIKQYNIKNDETNTDYMKSYIESFLSSSTVDSNATKTDKELYKVSSNPDKYSFNK